MIRGFLEWLGTTPWSIRLVESYYVWPVIETSHVLTIAFFVGTAIMMDLRLLGVSFGGVPVSEFTGRMLRWTRAGFVLMVVTGLLIFYSAPIRYYHNVFFRMKMLLLVLAGLNIWFFHARIHQRVAEWDHDASPPRAARLAGALSITFWLLIVAFGRMIAYNWFDCGLQPQPSWVNWLAACVLPTE